MTFELNKKSLVEEFQEIVESFGYASYFGNVHAFETPSEGLCTLYCVDLKPRFPSSKQLQFATLWILLELRERPSLYIEKSGADLQEALREQFQFVVDSWNTRAIEDGDVSRAKEIVDDCQLSISKNINIKGWGTERQVGYYLNDKYKGAIIPQDITAAYTSAKSGFVISDEWNEFMFVIENKNVYSMFYWFTGA